HRGSARTAAWVLARLHENPMKPSGGPGDLDPDVGAAAGMVGRHRPPAMGTGDDVDDREAEPRAAPRPRLIGPAEALEGPVEEARREPRPPVDHMQLDDAVSLRGPE